jgi:hypothetical protein
VETELLVEALGSIFWCLVNIQNLPSLVSSTITSSAANLDGLTFLVLILVDLKYLVIGWVDKCFILIFEDLEPSRVCAPDLHVRGSSSALNIPRLLVIL